MNRPLTSSEVKALPPGFTSTSEYATRRQRRSPEYEERLRRLHVEMESRRIEEVKKSVEEATQ